MLAPLGGRASFGVTAKMHREMQCVHMWPLLSRSCVFIESLAVYLGYALWEFCIAESYMESIERGGGEWCPAEQKTSLWLVRGK